MIYERYVAAWENLDVEDYLACCHEDYEMTFHSLSGPVVNYNDYL
jgi:ketosteroid isomerase-like protein